MPKFRKKPVEIEAMQFQDHASGMAIQLWSNNAAQQLHPVDEFMVVVTLEGTMKAMRNDWIIKGVKGEFYPCKPEIFAATYDSV